MGLAAWLPLRFQPRPSFTINLSSSSFTSIQSQVVIKSTDTPAMYGDVDKRISGQKESLWLFV